ncbi:phospholipase effector Tle1 domain-containing protein, partial [Bradyrhizobium sp.]|uniref:phospholipase effector Tle1 domain-containing protein n=1 Tax=Bradyrhizobium sp. TaxID=376 RepID=UPI003C74A97B
MSRNIVLLSDGTGNSAAKVWRTNVWRTFEALDLSGSDQVAFYDDGVGTSSFKPWAIFGGAFGIGLKRNVIDIYKFACRNHRDDNDRLFGFGFSRGAFTIRVVGGLILNQGLVTAQNEKELDQKARAAYRQYRRERYHTIWGIEDIFRGVRDLFLRDKYEKADNRHVAKVHFVGVWDTVSAYGAPLDEMTRGISRYIWPLELPTHTLPRDRVTRACQALALDEERTTFHPELWNEGDVAVGEPDPARERFVKDEQLSQVWFAG